MKPELHIIRQQLNNLKDPGELEIVQQMIHLAVEKSKTTGVNKGKVKKRLKDLEKYKFFKK